MAFIDKSNKTKMEQVLEAPDKQVNKTSGANGVLSRMWRQMLLDKSIRLPRFGALLEAYVLNPKNHVPNNRKDQISARGNLTKEFSRPQMTWKVFCKALRFLNIIKIEITIKAYDGTGKISFHSTTVDFGNKNETEEFNELLDQDSTAEFIQEVECLDDNN